MIITDVDTQVLTTPNAPAQTTINPVTEVRNVGTTLRIFPKINADRSVTLNIQQDSSSVLPAAANIPVSDGQGGITTVPIDIVDTANLSATVVARDGMTIAVGGMIRTTVNTEVKKMPLLGDIPGLELLFSRRVFEKQKTELVLLITPHILLTAEEGGDVSGGVTESLSRHPYFERRRTHDFYLEQDRKSHDRLREEILRNSLPENPKK